MDCDVPRGHDESGYALERKGKKVSRGKTNYMVMRGRKSRMVRM